MKIIMRIILIYLFFTVNVISQTNQDFSIKPKVSFGYCWTGYPFWTFTMDRIYSPKPSNEIEHSINLGSFYGFGIETSQFLKLYDTDVEIALDYSYGQMSTDKVLTISGEAEFQITSIPIMFWVILKPQTILRPFLKFGIGYQIEKWEETYFQEPGLYDVNFEKQSFALGVGAGLEFNLISDFIILLFVDAHIKDYSFTEKLNYNRNINFYGKNSILFAGISVEYLL